MGLTLLMIAGGLTDLAAAGIGDTVLTNKPAGPAFTRKRWKKFLEAEEAAREAERKARALKKAKEREEALRAAEEARAAIAAERQRALEGYEAAQRVQAVHRALDNFNVARSAAEKMRATHALAIEAAALRQRQMEEDDEIAIVLLLS